jgi:hypothetical protein
MTTISESPCKNFSKILLKQSGFSYRTFSEDEIQKKRREALFALGAPDWQRTLRFIKVAALFYRITALVPGIGIEPTTSSLRMTRSTN